MKKALSLVLSLFLLLICTACGGNDATEGFTEIAWPTSELVSRLPVPESTFGEINSERADYFSVDIGNISNAQFNAYVSACQEAGFTVDYSKSNTSFSAYDEEGNYVWLYYSSEDEVMDITIRKPEEEEPEEEEPEEEEPKEEKSTTKKSTTSAKTTTTTKSSDSDIDPDFKAAMDSYEEFMSNYVDFMKKYQANPTDMGLLADYATYISDYAKFCDDFAKWEDEDLNTAELAYYLDVQTRVNKKLLEVAQ